MWTHDQATVESHRRVPHGCVGAKKTGSKTIVKLTVAQAVSHEKNSLQNISSVNPVVHKNCRLLPLMCAGVDIGAGRKTTTIRTQNSTTKKFLAQFF